MRDQDRIGLLIDELWVWPATAEAYIIEDVAPTEFFIVRAACPKPEGKKVRGWREEVQVRLPRGADVATLRQTLHGADLQQPLSENCKVMAEKLGLGVVALEDSEPVPEAVTLTEFRAFRGFYAVFTDAENATAFRMVRDFCRKPESQMKINSIWEESKGDEFRHSLVISQMLGSDVYPDILRRFGMPANDNPLHSVMHAMQKVTEGYEASYMWLEAETTMRNRVKSQAAYAAVMLHHEKRGLPPPAPLPAYLQG